MGYSEFDKITLNQVATYLHIELPKMILHVVWLGESYVVKVNETKGLGKDVMKIHERIKKFLEDIGRRGLAN